MQIGFVKVGVMPQVKYRPVSLFKLVGWAAFVWLAGCAATSPDGASAVRDNGGSLPSDCILGGNVRDFTALDNRNLILYGPGNRPYHVVLTRPAIGLEREFSIGVYDADAAFGGIGRICPYGGDAIIIEGPVTDSILIRSIEQIDDTAVEALMVRFGKAEATDDDDLTVTEIQ
jgi:hypothetical protein